MGISSYRFLFNGKERVDEVYGDANAYDSGARIYDPRIVRWMSVDPMARERSWLTPYNFVQNNPLSRVDPTGMLDDDITLNAKGEVEKIVRNGKPNRFFDENGKELFFNDPKESDAPMMTKRFNEGDKVYEPLSRKETQKALDDAGSVIDFGALDLPITHPFRIIFSYKYAKASYVNYDFAYSFIQGRLGISQKVMGDIYFGKENKGYVDGVPFVRFEGSNILYNVPDAGNFMWGKKAADNYVSKQHALDAAELNENLKFGTDSEADQRAISNGYDY